MKVGSVHRWIVQVESVGSCVGLGIVWSTDQLDFSERHFGYQRKGWSYFSDGFVWQNGGQRDNRRLDPYDTGTILLKLDLTDTTTAMSSSEGTGSYQVMRGGTLSASFLVPNDEGQSN